MRSVPVALSALFLIIASSCTHMPEEPTEMVQRDSDTQVAAIRAVIAERVKALRAMDAERVAASLSPRIVAFEMVPPLSLPAGAAADIGGIRNWLEGWRGPVDIEVRDLTIHADGDVAFSHSLNRLSGTMTDGRKVNIWMRSTMGLRKVGGEWKIVHSHTSVPFLTDGSSKAALDLEP